MVRSVSAYSSKTTQEEVLKDLCNQIDAAGKNPILIVYFADLKYFWFISTYLKKQYPGATTIGSTSYINMTNVGYGYEGASALAIFSGIECAAGCIFEIGKHPANYIMHVKNAIESLSSYDNTCCLEFSTAMPNGEELVLDTFELAFKGLPVTVIGGSAGTKTEEETLVSLNGEVYKRTCVFCLIHNVEGRIFFFKEHIFKPTQYQFITTDVDCENRTVYEYNDKTAANVLAETLKVPVEKLPEVLEMHPVGRIENGEIIITAIKKVNEDGSLDYFSRLYNRSKVALLEVDDIEAVWKKTLEEVKRKIPNPSFSFVVNCYGRTKIFEQFGLVDKFADTLKDNHGNVVSISGFGEQLKYSHLNQTMVMALFE